MVQERQVRLRPSRVLEAEEEPQQRTEFYFQVRFPSLCFQVFPPPGQTKSRPAGVRRPPQRLCAPPGQERVSGDRRHGDGRG